MDVFALAIQSLRQKLQARIDAGEDTVGGFAKRAGVSGAHVTNFLKGRKSPGKKSLPRFIEAMDTTFVALLDGVALAAVPALAGSISAQGAVDLNGESAVGRFEFLEASDDPELLMAAGGFLLTEEATAFEVDRWHVVAENGEAVLMRAYSFGKGVVLRRLGQRLRVVYDPEVHELKAVVRWEMRPAQ